MRYRDFLVENNGLYNWFRGSKIVTTDNKPLLVYHGTGEIFNKFDSNKTKFVEDKGGLFFTNQYGVAKAYADEYSNGHVISAYLRSVNPMEITASDGLTSIEMWDYSNGDIASNAIASNHDGVIINSTNGENLYVVFDPNQIWILSKS